MRLRNLLRMNKSDVQRFMAGHVRANQRIAQEREERLRAMTPEEACADFAALDALWYSRPHHIEESDLRVSHVQALLHVRKLLAKACVARKHDRPV